MRKFITDIALLLERDELNIVSSNRWDAGFYAQFTTAFTEDSYNYYLIRDKKGRFVCGISSGLFFPRITTETRDDCALFIISWREYYHLKKFANKVSLGTPFGKKISEMVERSNAEITKKL